MRNVEIDPQKTEERRQRQRDLRAGGIRQFGTAVVQRPGCSRVSFARRRSS